VVISSVRRAINQAPNNRTGIVERPAIETG